jgi:UDP-glucose 4-epimerase
VDGHGGLGMKVLVTGGAGYIGSHAVRALQQAGHQAVVLDNLSHGHRQVAEQVLQVPLIVGDLADRALVEGLLQEHAIEAVLHFAAFTYVGESVADPSRYYSNNVAGTLALLDALVATGRARGSAPPPIVFSSTAATYGIPTQDLITEDHPTQPINPYGASKLMVERMLADFGHAYGLRSVIFRYFNAAGADPTGDLGEAHDPETHLIPLVLDAITGRRAAIQVFGTDYPTPDGTCIRDYIHVADLADAHVLGLERLLAAAAAADAPAAPSIYNLGNGTGYSVQQVIEAARAVTGRDLRVEVAPRRAGDPPVLVASSARARAELGWSPRYDDLATILHHAWQWHQRRFA